ncbi:MAG: Flp pilus assembly complex ATPase component TadA, partial [candidate division Zixibacteria bacterium]|nr:Flp pilus assembly complex ATPase component TadA [candidate division Zixibacteria bacterium]
MNQRIGDILIEKGVITEEILQQTLTIQTKTGKKLGEVLVDEKFITENDLAEAISERLGVPKLSLENISIDPDLVKLIGYEIAKKHRLVPVFKLGNTLTVAMADPLDVVAMDELRYLTKLRINRVVSTNSSVMAAIEEHYSMKDSLDKALEDAIRQKEADLLEADPDQRDEALAGEAPVIKYVNLLVVQAIKNKASDIHIEPDENSVRVRYRVSGLLRQEGSPPKAVQSALITRLKIMADVDVSEKRVPQDGRFTFKWGNQKVDVRLSTLPTIHGEKIVMRLLDRRNLLSGMGSLGFDDNMLEQFR